MGKWDFFFSSHAYTEPADLGLERTWVGSELKCVVGKISSLDLQMQLVEGFDPSASALLFYQDHFFSEQGGMVILYIRVFFENAFLF